MIVAVDGKSIAGEPADVATAQIKGPPGTEVELTVLDPSTGKRRTLEPRARARSRCRPCEGKLRRGRRRDQVAYVQLAGFSEGAHGELRDEIERLYERGRRGPRARPARQRRRAAQRGRADLERVRRGRRDRLDRRAAPSRRPGLRGRRAARSSRAPIVVLINGDTASAAEILTAALEEHGLATRRRHRARSARACSRR